KMCPNGKPKVPFRLRAAFCVLILSLIAGCVSDRKQPPAAAMQPVGEVAQVHIMASPVGLNLDNSAGADGFAAKVFFNDGRNAKSVPVRKGTLEVLMFDGPIPAGTQGIQPLKTWRFTSEELISHEFKSHIGVGYDFV